MEKKCRRINWVQLMVKEPRDLIEWFCREFFFAKVDGDDCRIVKGNCRLKITQRNTRDKDYTGDTCFSGYEHLALETKDIGKALDYCQNQGMRLETDEGKAFFNPQVWGTGMLYFNILTDFGVKVEISQRLDLGKEESKDLITGLEHIGLETSDLKRSICYYEELGFRKACQGVVNITAEGFRVSSQMMILDDVIIELYQFEHKHDYQMNENNGLKCLVMEADDLCPKELLSVGPDGECAVFI